MNDYKKNLWVLLPVLLLVLIASILAWRIIERKKLQSIDTSAKAESLLPIKVMEVQTGDIAKLVRYSGIINAWQKAIILSEVAGKVKSISAKVGDSLEPGSPILKIDDEMLGYTVEQAQASVLQLEANHETSKRELARKKSLFKNRVISDFEFDIAKAKEKADRAILDSAKASLKMAKRDLRETLIASPIRGTLAERTVDIGTNVGRGTKVATVVEIERVKIRVGVSEKEIAKIKEGLEVSVETDAYPGKSYTGSVYSVGTKADDVNLSFPIEIVVVNNQVPVLKPGMVARAAIKTGIYENVVSLPQETVTENEGKHFVWTINNDRAHKVFIIPAGFVGSDIILKAGLKPGQVVVVSGHERLFEGCSVQIVEE